MVHGVKLSALVACVLCDCCSAEEPWEWAGIFTLPAGHYTWSAEKSAAGAYADPQMKLVIVPVSSADDTGLHAVEGSAETLWNGVVPQALPGSDIETDSRAYSLVFDQHTWATFFVVHIDTPGSYAFFAEHYPTEFETRFHYFKTEGGEDVEPAFVEGASAPAPAATPARAEFDDDWGEVILGSFLTCVPTLFGVLFIAPAMGPGVKTAMEKSSGVINSFASGVIFAAAVFLLLPEGLYLAGSGQDEVTACWTWGSSILLGWFTCMLVHHFAHVVFGSKTETAGTSVEDGSNPEQPLLSLGSRLAIAVPVLLGDFFHNLSDGLVIGIAFKVCGPSFGWQLVGVTFAHEAPQELADLVVLIMEAQVPWHWATLANFLSSLSTVIGAIITYSADVSSNTEGYILAYGAGVYIFVALSELGPKILKPQGENKALGSIAQIAGFAFGCIAMGLVLLGHEHCSPPPVVSDDGTVVDAGGHGH
jgi:zinc transporter ZupT